MYFVTEAGMYAQFSEPFPNADPAKNGNNDTKKAIQEGIANSVLKDASLRQFPANIWIVDIWTQVPFHSRFLPNIQAS